MCCPLPPSKAFFRSPARQLSENENTEEQRALRPGAGCIYPFTDFWSLRKHHLPACDPHTVDRAYYRFDAQIHDRLILSRTHKARKWLYFKCRHRMRLIKRDMRAWKRQIYFCWASNIGIVEEIARLCDRWFFETEFLEVELNERHYRCVKMRAVIERMRVIAEKLEPILLPVDTRLCYGRESGMTAAKFFSSNSFDK